MTHALLTLALPAALRLIGLDVFIEADAPGRFLDFDRVNHGAGEHEAWGLGLHIVVSPLTRTQAA